MKNRIFDKTDIMNAKHLILLLITIGLISCNSSDDSRRTNETITYEYYDNAEMVFAINQGFESLTIEPGTNTVFKYFFMAEEDEDIADDEYSESIYFEVDGSLDNFSYDNNDIEFRDLNLTIRRSCFCANTGFVFPSTGSVSGTKSANGVWNVSISMSFQWDGDSETQSRTVNGVFELQPIP